MYADDLKLYAISNVHALENALKALESLSSHLHLPTSVQKTFVMHIGRNNPRSDYVLDGSPIAKVSEVKGLEVTYTDHRHIIL
ncbi:hypothetical protein L596_022407 [Steinernema carpocapsae]|uniref:Reverse transcriptase domain-containing protein n=1 Tax=Steinernema carpocapsae TaxID=34508 RepID=A0A4U5MMH6_STECR|nr:hypothetical protein L596_022407 [Steinernema carpocapsae]